MNYSNLQRLLSIAAASALPDDWVSANDLTNKIILEKLSEIRRSKGNLVKATSNSVDANELVDFPCEILKSIDQLWSYYSFGRFGFSIQLSIYEACENLEKFYESVGWEYSEESEEAEPGYHIVKYADPIGVIIPEFRLFSRDIQQWVSLKRVGSLRVVRGNLPYCIKLFPAILLRFKACE
ncbi:MAG: GUN4 domain-containing protein [Microcoleus sp.]